MQTTCLLVTGGLGFIGSNFIRMLIDLGYRVVNLDAITYAGNPRNLSGIAEDSYKFYHGSINDSLLVGKILANEKPSGIINFAAETHVDRSIDSASPFVMTNVMGTLVLLESSLKYWRENPEFKFLHVSTDEVYGSISAGYSCETSRYDPNSPYAASKASSDHLVKSFYTTHGLPCMISNASNNFGPYQFPEKLIPVVIFQALVNKPIPIYGTGENVRDWLYVADHCSALLTIFNHGKIGEAYNVGGETLVTNIDLVKQICDILNELVPADKSYQELITFVTDRPGHDLRYALDISKIKQQLGWQPSSNFKQKLQQTITWYLDNKQWCEDLQARHDSNQRLGSGLVSATK